MTIHPRIYISGPMTGWPNLNREAFDAAEARLRGNGWFTINPHRLSEKFGTLDDLTDSFACLFSAPDAEKEGGTS